MIIKHPDNKSELIEALEALRNEATGTTRQRIEEELRILRAGIKAEQEVAYLIDFDLRDSKNTAVIHDLRLEVNGRVAQIDHLIIHRSLQIFVLETKGFSSGLKITEEGEFLRWNDWKKTYEGMASPLAQNNRHIAVLDEAVADDVIPTRLGVQLRPTFNSVVLVVPKARVDRPKHFKTTNVVKADVLLPYMEQVTQDQGMLGLITRLLSREQLTEVAEKIAALHRPVTFDYRARFGLDIPAPAVSKAKVSSPVAPAVPQGMPQEAPKASTPEAPSPANGLACRHCRSTDLSVQYGKFGYYLKCVACDGNTPIKISCGQDGHKERIRKDGTRFYRECPDCGSSRLFFENAA